MTTFDDQEPGHPASHEYIRTSCIPGSSLLRYSSAVDGNTGTFVVGVVVVVVVAGFVSPQHLQGITAKIIPHYLQVIYLHRKRDCRQEGVPNNAFSGVTRHKDSLGFVDRTATILPEMTATVEPVIVTPPYPPPTLPLLLFYLKHAATLRWNPEAS